MIKIPRELFLTSVILDSNKYIKCVEWTLSLNELRTN
jgi:hypothetical protein